MTVRTEKNIFRSNDLAIDFFSWRDGLNKNIALTFTPFGLDGAVLLDGAGYAGELLLRNDFDVVAFKSSKNLWYQNLSQETIAAVDQFIATRATPYVKRVGYGSSMGGYAAIQFSRSLKLDVVLALSPQFEIDKSYDQRWCAAAALIDFRYRIDSGSIADECKYFVAYDPGTEDFRHVEKLRELIDSQRLVEIPTPYSGHPVGHYLAESGLIQDLALSVLKYGSVVPVAKGTYRKRSKTYLYELSKHLATRNKNKSALIAIDRAITIDGGAPGFRLHRSVVLGKLKQHEAALTVIDEAITIDSDAPELHLHRSFVLSALGQPEAALDAVEKAITIDNDAPELHLQRSIVLDSLDRPEAALGAVYEARRKLKYDAQLLGALSDRLAKHHDFAGALDLVDKAISIDDSVLQFHMHKCAVCKALGDIAGAISAGESALKLSPSNASLMARLSRLHARHGGIAHWARSVVLARNAICSLFS